MSLLKECFTLSIRLTTMGGCFGCREREGDIPFKLWSNNNLNNSEERSMPMKSCGEGVETHGDCVEILCNALIYRGNRLAAQGSRAVLREGATALQCVKAEDFFLYLDFLSDGVTLSCHRTCFGNLTQISWENAGILSGNRTLFMGCMAFFGRLGGWLWAICCHWFLELPCSRLLLR